MPPIDTPTLSDTQTLQRARALVKTHLPLEVDGYRCSSDTLTDALLAVAARGDTLETVCHDLEAMPTAQTLRTHFNNALTPEHLDLVECCINLMLAEAIAQPLHQRLSDQAHDIAIDFHDRPYYGKDKQDEALWVRSRADRGTTRFHRIATAYLIRDGVRFTLAIRFVRPSDSTLDVVKALVSRLEDLKVAIRHLLFDKGFCSIAVLRYLQESTHSAIVACPVRGKKTPAPGGTRALCQGRRSYRTQYTFRNAEGHFTAEVVVCCGLTTARRTGRMPRRRQWLLFVVIACRVEPKKVRRLYSRRFGIETSYRQSGVLRGRTSSRNAVYRFLLLGLAFVLLAVWTGLRYEVVQVPRRGGRLLAEARFRLRRFARFIVQALERQYRCCREIEIQATPIF